MQHSSTWPSQDSIARSSSPDVGSAGTGTACAIHQPNLFPRLSTLAKLFTADVRIVLDDVQFARRDYQHRARLGALSDPDRWQWLSLGAHLPDGRATLITDVVIADPLRSRRRLDLLTEQYYRHSSHWDSVRTVVEITLAAFDTAEPRLCDVAEASTRALLEVVGWHGETLLSSQIPSGTGRSERLADLATIVGADTYVCGTGGMRYLEPELFHSRGIQVLPFVTPPQAAGGIWASARQASSLWALATAGPAHLHDLLAVVSTMNRALLDVKAAA